LRKTKSEDVDDIITPRLTLRLLGAAITNACLNGSLAAAQDLLQATIPEEFLDDLNGLQNDCLRLQEDPAYTPWATRAIILTSEMKMIGSIRFHNSPAVHLNIPYRRGGVELGYEIFSTYRRKGYAREAISAIMSWAGEQFGVQRFIASISPENLPSLELVQSFGFIKIDDVMDEADGPEYVYMLEREV